MLLSADERKALADLVEDLFEKEWSMASVREADADPGRWAPAIWDALREVDVVTLGLPAEHGGSGGGMAELRLVCEAIGRHLVPIPFLWSGVLATGLVTAAAPSTTRDVLLDALREADIVTIGVPRGDLLVSRSEGPPNPQRSTAYQVPYGTSARYALLFDGVPGSGGALPVVDLSLVAPIPQHRSDLQVLSTLRLESLAGSDAEVGRLELGLESYVNATARWKIAVAALALGGEERLTELCSSYAIERQQFGRSIGAFQAVAHPIVDMDVRATSDRLLIDLASWRADSDDPRQWMAATQAKAAATEGYARASRTAIQVHGGHGFSEENDVQLHFRRSRGLQVAWGSPAQEHAAAATAFHGPELMAVGASAKDRHEAT